MSWTKNPMRVRWWAQWDLCWHLSHAHPADPRTRPLVSGPEAFNHYAFGQLPVIQAARAHQLTSRLQKPEMNLPTRITSIYSGL